MLLITFALVRYSTKPEVPMWVSELSGKSVPLVFLDLSKPRLLHNLGLLKELLERNPNNRYSYGLCSVVSWDATSYLCIEQWLDVQGYTTDTSYPCDRNSYAFKSDNYKLQNPKRRDLAKYMCACIEYSLAKM